jgi:hypothetical protein
LLPFPESGTLCGLVVALSVTVRVAVGEPVLLGANLTSMVQLSVGASELGHRLLGVKSPASTPVTPTLEMSNAVVPVFVTVTLFVRLWPASTVPKIQARWAKADPRIDDGRLQLDLLRASGSVVGEVECGR